MTHKKNVAICQEHIDLEAHVYNALREKRYVNVVRRDVPYGWGQLDVYAKQNSEFDVYYEIKKTYSPKSLAKVKKQADLWLMYQASRYPGRKSFVVLVTPTKVKRIGNYRKYQSNSYTG